MKGQVSEVMVKVLNSIEAQKMEETRRARHMHSLGLIASIQRRYAAKRSAVIDASIDLTDIPLQCEGDVKVFSEILNEVALTSF